MRKTKMGYNNVVVIIVLCYLAPVTNQQLQGVNLLWQGVQFPNNSILNIEDIGEGEHALVCQTDKRPCCRPIYDVYYHRHRIGEWYYPNGSRVPIQGGGATFYRNRNDDGMVRLNRRNHEIDYSTGIYCCVVPDASDVNRTLCIGLLSIGGTSSCSLSQSDGSTINNVSYNATSFTLSCDTSDGIATYISENECNIKQQLVSFSQQVTDPFTSRYSNELRWRSQGQGSYICSTRNRKSVSYAVLLMEFGADQESCSSQIVGTLGRALTLLCLANEPVTNAVWTTPDGMRASDNITFSHLNTSHAGEYICRGTIQERRVLSMINLRISRCSALVYVRGIPATIRVTHIYDLSCNTFYWETGCYSNEEEYYFYVGNELISRNRSFEFRVDSVSVVLSNHYFCVVTVNGSNFTSNPARAPTMIQLPRPLSVSISIDMDNPIPLDSSPILSCTVSFSPAIDIDIEIVTEWSGPTYGLGEYITTEPVSNSSAEVPTYTSTARLDAPGTFYDSGNYNCSVVANPLTNLDFIHSSPAVSSQLLSVLFLAPRRPHLNRIQVGHNWIYITWNRSLADNVSSYQVGYSYTGACRDINQQELLLNQIVGGRNSSYNITGLRGYSNYNISLTSINDTGRSPPNIALVLTDTTVPSGSPQMFSPTLVFSTNITMQWKRVRCSERNSEISRYVFQHSLEGSNRFTCVSVSGINDSDRTYTATRLQPLSMYTFTIAAVNVAGQRGPNTAVTVITSAPESVVFQLHLSGVHSCLQWRITDPEDKVHDVMVGIASGVNQQCPSCELEQTNITNGEFQCFPGSPNQVTFRAKVHDRAQAAAREVITHIEQWITSSDVVTLPVHHARLNVNNTCVVLLASFDDPECPEYLTPPFPAINKTSVGDNIMNDPECLDGSVPISEPVHTTTSSTDETYSSTEPTKGQETTSGLTGTSIQDVPTGSTSQSMTTTNNQFITTPPLTTGIFDQGQTAQNEIEKETVSSTEDERGQQQFQFDAGAIVGGVVAIIFIITAGIVIMFVLYSILKYCQTTKQLSPQKNTDADDGQCKAATKSSAKAEDLCEDEMYEVVEMQDLVTSSTKSRYTPAQLPQEGTATQPVESEANKETAPAQEENEEIYLNCE